MQETSAFIFHGGNLTFINSLIKPNVNFFKAGWVFCNHSRYGKARGFKKRDRAKVESRFTVDNA